MRTDVPREGVKQRTGIGRQHCGPGHRRNRRTPGNGRYGWPGGAADGPQHRQPLTHRRAAQDAVRQHNPEGFLYPRPQLDKDQAVQAQVGSEPAVQPDRHTSRRDGFPR